MVASRIFNSLYSINIFDTWIDFDRKKECGGGIKIKFCGVGSYENLEFAY